jgi:hypothetical protein
VAPTANTWESGDTALGYWFNTTYYGAYGRLMYDMETKTDAQPQFKCPNETNDLFTLTTSPKGNKKLTKAIGLITMDESWYAGVTYDTKNPTVYLSGNINDTWTMTPLYFSSYVGDAYGWYLDSRYDSISDALYYEYGVRPVINLKSNVEITGGNGTSGSPYVIKTN